MGYIKRRITTTLPTALEPGEEIYYRDANGVQTLWVGNADGEAWPAVGYKEYVARVTQAGTNAPVAAEIANTIGAISWSRVDVGSYQAQLPNNVTSKTGFISTSSTSANMEAPLGDETGPLIAVINASVALAEIGTFDTLLARVDSALLNYVTIRIYP